MCKFKIGIAKQQENTSVLDLPEMDDPGSVFAGMETTMSKEWKRWEAEIPGTESSPRAPPGNVCMSQAANGRVPQFQTLKSNSGRSDVCQVASYSFGVGVSEM